MSDVALPPVLRPLAHWAAGLDAACLPEGTDQAIANTALDWAGAAIAGTAHPLFAPYVAAFAACGAPGPGGDGCRVVGDARAWSTVDAAAANAAISHFWEFDDAHRAATMHPGITVWPAVFALAQARPGIDVATMRAAVVAGYEVGIRVGTLLGKQHYAVCHSTATAGTFCAAAAAARLLGLDGEQTLSALGHAGTQAAGLWQFLDDGVTDAKAFHAGLAVRNGVTAALLAEAGIPGAPRILEGPRGMLAAWHLAPRLDGDFVPAAGAALEITRTTIKGWPVCGQMHSLLDATETLHKRLRLPPNELTRILVEVPTALLDIADVKRPASVSQMKFSTSFCVAVLLSGGSLPFAGFDERLLRDDALHRLADRIDLVTSPAFDVRFPQERPARITVTTRAGETASEERSFRRGDPEAPWPWAPLVERFRAIVGLAEIGPAAQQGIIDWCAGFGRGDAVSPRAEAIFRGPRAPAQTIAA